MKLARVFIAIAFALGCSGATYVYLDGQIQTAR